MTSFHKYSICVYIIAYVSGSFLFVLLTSISLCGYITFCWSSHLLLDILVVFLVFGYCKVAMNLYELVLVWICVYFFWMITRSGIFRWNFFWGFARRIHNTQKQFILIAKFYYNITIRKKRYVLMSKELWYKLPSSFLTGHVEYAFALAVNYSEMCGSIVES